MSEYGQRSTVYPSGHLKEGELYRFTGASRAPTYHRVVGLVGETAVLESAPAPSRLLVAWWATAARLRTAWFHVSFWLWYRWRS